MTGFPKELITSSTRCATHSASSEYANKRAVEKIDNDRFKKCMHSQSEEEEQTSETKGSEESDSAVFAAPNPLLMERAVLTTAQSAAVVNRDLPIEVAALFEKMASTMIVMTSADVRETSLVLDGPQFSSSVFFGTRITIKEFSTAPRIFNIEIASQTATVHLLEAHKGILMSSFEGGKFAFTVNRLETVLHSLEENFSSPHRDSDNDDNKEKDDS